MSWDQTLLIGRIGNVIELRQTQSGKSVVNLSVAKRKYDDSTIWIKCVAWGKNAENIAKFFKQGQQILIIGELDEPEAWVDKEGNAKGSTVVTVNTWRFVEGKNEEATTTGTTTQKPAKKKKLVADELDLDAILAEEEIPF